MYNPVTSYENSLPVYSITLFALSLYKSLLNSIHFLNCNIFIKVQNSYIFRIKNLNF